MSALEQALRKIEAQRRLNADDATAPYISALAVETRAPISKVPYLLLGALAVSTAGGWWWTQRPDLPPASQTAATTVVTSSAPAADLVPAPAKAPAAAPAPARSTPPEPTTALAALPAPAKAPAPVPKPVTTLVPKPAPAPAPEPARQAATPDAIPAEAPELLRSAPETLTAGVTASKTAQSIEADFRSIERLLARAEHQDALEAVGRLEKFSGETWRTRYLAGVAWSGLNRWEEARSALSTAWGKNPNHVQLALYLSVAMQELGRHDEALQVMDQAIAKAPHVPEFWLNRFHSLQALRQPSVASQNLRRFLELSADRPDLRSQRTWVQNRLAKDD